VIRLLISITVVLFFALGDTLGYFFYPDARTVTDEWDGSNALLMNVTSLLLFLSFLKTFLPVKYEITYLFDIGVLWFSFADIADRILGQYNLTQLDQVFIIPCCVILSTLTHLLYVNFIRKKTINKQ
jgi:hypothetical protein